MVRRFEPRPVDPVLLEELLDLARRAPSAGFAQGTHFVALQGSDTAMFWDTTLPLDRRAEFPWPGLLDAPLIVLPMADEGAYRARYGEADKASTGLADGAWPVPYWQLDAAMASMILLLAAVDAGLGALFFGVFGHETELCVGLGVPAGVRPIGAIAIGYPAEGDRLSQSAKRGRRPLDEVVHHGRW